MEFTREPIIETIITPKEGYKLAVRRSQQEEPEDYLVDAVEIVSFGSALFFRSLERPKSFLLPVSDYEVIEVRETRMVLKTPSIDRSIKIGGGREPSAKQQLHKENEKQEEVKKEEVKQTETHSISKESGEDAIEPRLEKKRERRRQSRKRRGRDESQKESENETQHTIFTEEIGKEGLSPLVKAQNEELVTPQLSAAHFSALLQPPPTLISETIERYRKDDAFKGAFYLPEEEEYKPHEKVSQVLNDEDNEDEELTSVSSDEGQLHSLIKNTEIFNSPEEEKSEKISISKELEEEKMTLPLFEEELPVIVDQENTTETVSLKLSQDPEV